MNARQQARLLPDGKRLHLQDGPIDLIVGAEGGDAAIAAAYAAAQARFATLLDELAAELPTLRQAITADSTPPHNAVAKAMFGAAWPYAARQFITPMAAVAGAGADAILAAMTAAAPLTRAYVNNGGDIALHLAAGTSFEIGMVDRPDRPRLFGKLAVSAGDPVRGIATSGRHGRSFSLGIADAVTVLAADAATADAAATMIANAVDLPDHPAVLRVAANSLQPDSDLGAKLVTRSVGKLSKGDIERALRRGQRYASDLLETGRIRAAALHLAGSTRIVPGASTLMVPIALEKETKTHAAG